MSRPSSSNCFVGHPLRERIIIEAPLLDAPSRFQRLAARLAALVPGARVEHIGSTAVVGLKAKPTLDMMLEWPKGARPADLIERLESDGFWHWYLDPFRADRLMFVAWADKGVPPVREANVHVASVDSAFWRDQILFRETLRTSPSLREEYAALKRALVARFGDDLDAYTAGKTEFVRRAIATRAAEPDSEE